MFYSLEVHPAEVKGTLQNYYSDANTEEKMLDATNL